MARAFWKGTISFGLVSIPVKMYVGTETHPIAFHLLHKKCLTRPRQVLRCDKDGEDITIKDTVRGYEYAKDQFIVLDEKDFARVPVKTTRTIDISGFVKASEIDPIYYEGTHYLEPENPGLKPFLLLRQALLDMELVAIAKVSFQRREHLCCLRPSEDSILLHTLYYSEDILPRTELAPPQLEIKPEELEMAKSLIRIMSGNFTPEKYRDEYRAALQELIEAKIRGKEIIQPPERAVVEVPDLMAAMRASIEAAKKTTEINKV
jgi:DNA end-binding protein Ku